MKYTALAITTLAACAVEEVDTTTQEATLQWAGPVAISPAGLDASVRYNFGKQIAIDAGGVVHVTWLQIQGDDSAPQVQGNIYYQRSETGGMSWSTPRRLTSATALVSFPKIAASGPNVYVVWHTASSSGIANSFISRSTNQGVTFTAPAMITTEHSAMPSVAASGSGVHVVFTGSTGEINVKSSTDFGAQWRPTQPVSSADGRSSWTPVIAANGTSLYVAWTDERHNRNPDGTPYDCGKEPDPPWATDDGCREEVYFRRSTTLGTTWGPEQRLTTSPQNVGHNAASLVFANGTLHISYFRKPSGSYGILYQRSLDGGATWSTQNLLTSSSTDASMRPSVAALNDNVGVVYTGIVSGVGARLFYARSTDRGATFATPTLVVPGNGMSMQPQLEIDPAGHSHVIFADSTTPGATTERVFYARTIPN